MPKIKPDKSLGQHFLKNESTIENICSQIPQNIKHVFEIGPGPATLTKKLVLRNSNLTVIETDLRFVDMLKDLSEEIIVIHQDALEYDFSDLPENSWIISNLPYNISVPLTVNFTNSEKIEGMTLMYQKEVGEKFLEGKKSNLLYSKLSAFFEISKVMTLKPGAFNPPPKVDSIVINFKRIDSLIDFQEKEKYFQFVQDLYSQKRKQIKKHLKNKYNANIELIFEDFDISLTTRAEDLKLEQVVNLFKRLNHGC